MVETGTGTALYVTYLTVVQAIAPVAPRPASSYKNYVNQAGLPEYIREAAAIQES